MNNDLISRSALKEEIQKIELSLTNKSTILHQIDNAPAVEERPKGAWYRTGQSFIHPYKFRNFGCSVCRYELDEHIKEEPNFCPNCGADMRGES